VPDLAKQRSAIIHSSWLDPRKVREMTIVGSQRMIVYDDLAPLEKSGCMTCGLSGPRIMILSANFNMPITMAT